MPLIDERKQLRDDKTVCTFRPEIIDDEKVACIKVILQTNEILPVISVEGESGQSSEELSRREINHRMALLQDFMCNTNGQERFSGAYITIEKQILIESAELSHKCARSLLGPDEICEILSLVPFPGEGFKVFSLCEFLNPRLMIEKRNLLRAEAAAFLISDVPRVMAVRAGVDGIKIVNVKTIVCDSTPLPTMVRAASS